MFLVQHRLIPLAIFSYLNRFMFHFIIQLYIYGPSDLNKLYNQGDFMSLQIGPNGCKWYTTAHECLYQNTNACVCMLQMTYSVCFVITYVKFERGSANVISEMRVWFLYMKWCECLRKVCEWHANNITTKQMRSIRMDIKAHGLQLKKYSSVDIWYFC